MTYYLNTQIEDLPNEKWKDIPGLEGSYQASTLGRIKSLNYKRGGNPGIITQCKNKKGYLMVTINKKTLTVHRLVAITFIENEFNKPQIDHLDTNRENNIVSNLRWCTPKENSSNELTKERVRKACSENLKKVDKEKRRKAIIETSKKCNVKKVKCITTGLEFNSTIEANEFYNITPATAVACAANPKCKGNRYAGFIINDEGKKIKLEWKYIE